MKQYKAVNVDLSDNSIDKPILEEYTKEGWQIHTTYPFAVGLFLLERDDPQEAIEEFNRQKRVNSISAEALKYAHEHIGNQA